MFTKKGGSLDSFEDYDFSTRTFYVQVRTMVVFHFFQELKC